MYSAPGRRMVHARFATLASMIGFAALLRLLPHPPNFTPIGGMALFAGAHFSSLGAALVVPLASMFLSDLALECLGGTGLHSTLPVVYLCFAMSVLIGRALRRRHRFLLTFGAVVASGILFFVATNLSVWILSDLYPKDPAGLGACFAAALPFYRNTLLGDLTTSGVLFGGFALAERRWPVLRLAAPIAEPR